jgi:glycosyltransferase involved in cell wall biosynthesis
LTKNIDIVLPMYNPVKGWAANVLENIEKLESSSQVSINLILVNDGNEISKIESELNWLKERVPEMKFIDSQPNRGKGFAVRTGLLHSTSSMVLLTDIDFPFTLRSMNAIIAQLSQGNCDLVLGQRNQSYYHQISGFRRRLSKFLTFINQYVFNLPVKDTQCGLKGLNPTGRMLVLQTTINRYLFDLELVFQLRRKMEVKICVEPVELNPDVRLSRMPLKILFIEGLNLLKLIIWK